MKNPVPLLFTLLLLALFPAAASAYDVSGQSRTYLWSLQPADNVNLLPLYEYLNASADGESVSFRAGGWYRWDLRDESFEGTKRTGDLQYAYLNVRGPKNSAASLGRVLVNEGVAAERIDGGYAKTDLWGGFRIAAFGGAPVETDRDSRSGDSVYGGRISQSVAGISTVGVSYLKEKNDSQDYREETGVDLSIRPFSKLEVLGKSSYNDLMRGWMQHAYYAVLGPFGPVRVTGEASRVYYGRYFLSTTMTAFAFPHINPYETITTTGVSADVAATDKFTVTGDYKKYDYDILNDSAAYYGGKLAYRGESFGAGAAYHRMDGPTDALRYDEARAYVTKKIAKVDLTVDGMAVTYDKPINGIKTATALSGALGYSFTPRAWLGADVEYQKNPDYNKDVRSMLTFNYQFDASFTSASKAKAPGGK